MVGEISPASPTHLSESLSIGAHVCEDNQDVLLALVGQELGRCESQAGRDDSLNARDRTETHDTTEPDDSDTVNSETDEGQAVSKHPI